MKKILLMATAIVFGLQAGWGQSNNVLFGNDALVSNSAGYRNVAMGDSTLGSNTTGYGNSALGHKALKSNVGGYFNTAVGGFSLNQTNSYANTAIGYKSQELMTTGYNNSSLGYQTLQQGSGSNNVAIGAKSMRVGGGSYNIGIGYASLNTVKGSNNVALGSYALDKLVSGSDNVAVGYRAGYTLTSGDENIMIGQNATSGNATSYNIVLGYRSSVPSGSNNITIGTYATLPANSTNSMNIGSVLYGSGLRRSSSNNYTPNGKIGINVVNPQYTLDVNGNIHIPYNSSLLAGDANGKRLRLYSDGYDGYIEYSYNLYFRNSAGEIQMTTTDYGNVGIGTITPDYTLDVNGTIRAKEVLVNLDGGADFVFEDNYNLRTLDEVHSFIKANRHLPEIPSAAEMTGGDGVDMGEMQVKLLQKIEELTLYIIEQDKRIKELEKKND